MTCPICDSKDVRPLFRLFDDRYGYPRDVDLVICGSCGHKFSARPLDSGEIARIYTDYYQRGTLGEGGYAPYQEPNRLWGWLNGELSSAARWVPPGVRVLDIGCGSGSYVGYHAGRGCDAHGVDADRNVGVIAEKYGLKIRTGVFDPSDYIREYFDYVTMDQVIEHVTDPLATLAGVWQVLKPDGCCVMSTPNANGWGAKMFGAKWLNWHVPYHQQFFTRQSLALAAIKTGFAVERMSTVTPSVWLVFQMAHLLTYPTRGRASLFWAPQSSRRRLDQVLMMKLLMVTRFTVLPQLITRFFDGRGMGDNYLLILRKKQSSGGAPRGSHG